ncbi:MAG: phosphonate ABC transporter, permease protein PhnE [Candidatus Limnocylindria bacterium]
MADYFISRGMPVPRELRRNIFTDWRRLLVVAVSIAVVVIGLRVTNIDTSRANPEYQLQILRQLVSFDFSILGPQNEFETFWDGGLGLMIVTILLAIVATAFSIVIALPLAFLGARNIMTGHPVTNAVYAIVRVFFTVVRSIDVLIVGILMVVLFGVGNAAGVFAIAFHNVGVIGKLYSEAIEGIDAGPIEAITATGANRVQVVWTAVLPQIVNPFISFTIYRLDTNVRLAPILGLVGAGGIGTLLFQTIGLLNYSQAGLIIFMIVVTVAIMDFFSARIRQRLI